MIRCGEIYFINKKNAESEGCEMRPGRPGVVISSEKAIALDGTVNVVYLTSSDHEKPFTITLDPEDFTHSVKKYPSYTALCRGIYAVDRGRLGNYLGKVSDEELKQIKTVMDEANFGL